jgi:hypothetical protein
MANGVLTPTFSSSFSDRSLSLLDEDGVAMKRTSRGFAMALQTVVCATAESETFVQSIRDAIGQVDEIAGDYLPADTRRISPKKSRGVALWIVHLSRSSDLDGGGGVAMAGFVGVRVGMLGALALALGGCPPPPPPPILATPLPGLGFPGSESSATYARRTTDMIDPTSGTPIPGHPGTLVVELNGSSVINSWAYSVNGGAFWTPCDVNKPSCGDGVLGVPKAKLSNVFAQQAWDGDPGVAASIDGRTVVMVNMAHTTRLDGLPDTIVLSSSIDGGKSFIKTIFPDPFQCVGYSEDQPSLAADTVVPNRFWAAWRHRSTEDGFYGVCAWGYSVDPATGSFTFVGGHNDIDVEHDPLRSPGGLIVQARANEVTIVNSNTGFEADVGCDGTYTNKWFSITSTDTGTTWTRKASIDQSNIRTCLPDSVDGAIETDIRNFAFVRDPNGTMHVAVPNDDNLGFKLLTSTDGAQSWAFDVIVAGNMQVVFPTLAVDDKGRLGLSFQAVGKNEAGLVAASTWFAAVPAGFVSFVGPVPISGGYKANNPPPQGSCSHSLCSTGAGLVAACDPTGCVNAVLAQNFACTLGWTRGCADLVGSVCKPFTCSTRWLGDYTGVATVVPSGDIPGVNATFMPSWTQTTISGAHQVHAALVQVSP